MRGIEHTKSALVVKQGEKIWELPIDIQNPTFINEEFQLTQCESAHRCVVDHALWFDDIELTAFETVSVSGADITWFPEISRSFSTYDQEEITIGNDPLCDIVIHCVDNVAVILCKNDLKIEDGSVYINASLVAKGSHSVCAGDFLFVGNTKITIQNGNLVIAGKEDAYTTALMPQAIASEPFENFPDYKRSPRIIKVEPTDTVVITAPPSKPEKEKGGLIKMLIPPLVTFALTIVVMIIQPRGIYVILSISSMVMTVIFTVTGYFSDKKKFKEDLEKRESSYTEYLLEKRHDLFKLKSLQTEALNYHYPSLDSITREIKNYSSRIFERNNYDDDFLTVSIGYAAKTSSYSISFSDKDYKNHNEKSDNLLGEANIVVNEFSSVENVPLVIDLKKAHLGLVGEKKYVHNQLMSIILQLVFFQSYHDIEIILLYEHKNSELFRELRWFPHFKIKPINVTGIISTENVADQVLGNLTQVMKQRQLTLAEEKKNQVFSPQYIFIVDDPKLIINHSIMEYLQKENLELGFSLIYITDILTSQPDNIKTILRMGDSSTGILEINEGALVQKKVFLPISQDIPFEMLARKIAPLNHLKGISNQIPESITFFEMYGITTPEELSVAERWRSNNSHKTLAVPLGVRGKEDYVELNLHEKAHGPHGLVAGTTGSGKSEIIQSYILSLAANFHPYEVGFLLIDYKGGGMAALFKNLPHLLGIITNLDGSESMRALASIKSELARRQLIFNQYSVNHINQYNRLFKSGEADKPMPHLFLISDEFAELKKEQPEFMSELISTARIGRSLGIHLILATQKPSGVVDDQIWSNSKFKLALKVQDKSDSNEVLKTPDAANITLPGRAYLQVGNNEVYELFQSAWSGAEYREEQETAMVDDRIYLLNDLGQRKLINQDLSIGEETGSRVTQLDATVRHIREVFDQLMEEPVEKPWHPPLETCILSPYINDISDVARHTGLNTKLPLGMIDVPEEQVQTEYIYDFAKDGNLAVIGVSTSGKSFTLSTLLMTGAILNSPSLLNYYIFDFGNASLIQMKELPHSADYITADEEDKLEKVQTRLEDEMSNRKAKLASTGSMSFIMYNAKNAEAPIPAILIVIDNYDAVKEIGYDLDELFVKISRDGQALGIFLIVSANRSSAIKYSMINNFKTRIVHYLMDKTDYNSLIGRPPYELPEIPGRAFVKRVNPNMMQVYMLANLENTLQYVEDITALISEINEKNTASKAEGIRTLPEQYSLQYLLDLSHVLPYRYAIGLDRETVEVQYLKFDNPATLILGPGRSGKTTILKMLLQQALDRDNEKIIIIDSRSMELSPYSEFPNTIYVGDEATMAQAFTYLETVAKGRKKDFEENGHGILPKEFYRKSRPVLVFVDDVDAFADQAKEMNAQELIAKLPTYNIPFIGTSVSNRLRGYDSITKMFKDSLGGVLLGNPSEQIIWNIQLRRYKPMPMGALLYEQGQVTEIKLPIFGQEEEVI